MCGRFALKDAPGRLAEAFNLEPPPVPSRTNICPSQPVTALLSDNGRPQFQNVVWGFVPFWAKEAKRPSINARAETAWEKPSFKAAYRHRRCLVPASCFYEWRRAGKARHPFRFAAPDGEQIALGGIWGDWQDGVTHMRTLAILTTAANNIMQPVHDRMPVIVPPNGWQDWLNPEVQHPQDTLALIQPAPDEWLSAEPILAVV